MLEVTIVGDDDGAPSPLMVAQAVLHLVMRRFPGRYRVEYVDARSAVDGYPEVVRAIEESALPLPVLAVGGRPCLAGNFSLNDVALVLEAAQ